MAIVLSSRSWSTFCQLDLSIIVPTQEVHEQSLPKCYTPGNHVNQVVMIQYVLGGWREGAHMVRKA